MFRMHREAKQTQKSEFGERFIAGPRKETDDSRSEKPELHEGSQQSIFKGQVSEGCPGCVISSCTIL